MGKFKLYQELNVRLPGHDYPILIGQNMLAEGEFLRKFVPSKQVLIVTNDTIAPLYLSSLQAVFSDRQCDVIILEDGEAFKNQQSLFKIFNALVEGQHHRDTILIALGGGVVGDITGFAAATYQRGVQFIQIPTTLLAQVDASIGGKTAINHPKAKNMIGSFHQPSAVIIDLNTLETLPQREFNAGIAEIIKYALIEDEDFLELVKSALQEGLQPPFSAKLPAIISQCCQIKMRIVQKDEREMGQRALLNLGHTFAHALESYTHYDRWLHGEAVAIGLYCAALLSCRHLHRDFKMVEVVDKMLVMANLPNRIPSEIDLQQLRLLMSQDKKIKNKSLRFILMKKIGDCYIEDQVAEEDLFLSLRDAVERS